MNVFVEAIFFFLAIHPPLETIEVLSKIFSVTLALVYSISVILETRDLVIDGQYYF